MVDEIYLVRGSIAIVALPCQRSHYAMAWRGSLIHSRYLTENMFSGLSSFIYYPAITALASSLAKSTGKINLTITIYLVVAGIAPINLRRPCGQAWTTSHQYLGRVDSSRSKSMSSHSK